MFTKNVSLAKYSNYKIGGRAKYFYAPKNVKDLISAVTKAKKEGLDIFIIAGGTNILISDEGFNGLALKPDLKEISLEEGGRVRVGAGVSMKDLLNSTIENSLSGLEWAGGLPGSVGGAVYGNAGAFGGEMKDSLVEVSSLDISSTKPKLIKRNNQECGFSYRLSLFKRDTLAKIDASNPTYAPPKEIILECVFQLSPASSEAVKSAMQEKISYRQNKQPLDYPNIGSMFKNISIADVPEEVLKKFKHKVKQDPFPVLPTAVLISDAGLKGVQIGQAQISEKHPNFIVNLRSAKASDVKQLVSLVRKTLQKKYGVTPEREVIFL